MDVLREVEVRIRRILEQRLESLQRAGVEVLRRAPSPEPEWHSDPTPAGGPHVSIPERRPRSEPGETRPSLATSPEADLMAARSKPHRLKVLAQEVASCCRCATLVDNRTQTVFGVGNPNARLCFFGEAPGADEDRQGEPFVGRAGRLLTDIIEKGMGLRREDVYILNTVKCRPPGNRNPESEEVENCRSFFERQFEIIRPEFICCLGAVAVRALLDSNIPLGRLRGKFFDYRGIKVIVTYHPAYLLRNPEAKKLTWQDIQLLMAEMGIEHKSS